MYFAEMTTRVGGVVLCSISRNCDLSVLRNILAFLNIYIYIYIYIIIIIRFRQCQGNYRSSVAYRDNYP